MPFTFSPPDNEFAVATGSNVGTTQNSSTFDNPPTSSQDLMVTLNEGDPDPFRFDLGDTYDVSWGGAGGGGSIEDAVVIRSDMSPDGQGGIIVLEGIDDQGQIAQVVWTPDFDLEGWYADNYNPSMEPQFYTQDTDPDYTHSYVCFGAGTLIDTPHGPRPVERIKAGDLVTTLDAGPQPVRWTGQKLVSGQGRNAPVHFAAGSIGNTRALTVSQQHRMLLASPHVDLCFGQPEAFAPAQALVNGTDIVIRPCARIRYVHLLLDAHHVLFAQGAPTESLFLGDQAEAHLYDVVDLSDTGIKHDRTARHCLRLWEVRLLAKLDACRGLPDRNWLEEIPVLAAC